MTIVVRAGADAEELAIGVEAVLAHDRERAPGQDAVGIDEQGDGEGVFEIDLRGLRHQQAAELDHRSTADAQELPRRPGAARPANSG